MRKAGRDNAGTTLRAIVDRGLLRIFEMKLFVFGTLKQGFQLRESEGLHLASFLGIVRKGERFPLLIAALVRSDDASPPP